MLNNIERRDEGTVRKAVRASLVATTALACQQILSVECRAQSIERKADEIVPEIIVTAQRREESLIETPISLSVVSPDQLQSLGAAHIGDWANSVPGLNLTTGGPGQVAPSIRGITIGYDLGPLVATMVDDVPIGSTTYFSRAAQNGFDGALFDLGRVEVLRGPQGTLYGASAMGGAISYVMKAPDTNEFSGKATVGISTTESTDELNYEFNGLLNVPVIADILGIRVGAFQTHDAGFISNVALDLDEVGRSDKYGARVGVLFTPNDDWRIELSGLGQNLSRDGDWTATYDGLGKPVYGSLDQFRYFEEPFDTDFRLGSLKVAYDVGPVTLTSITAYQTVRQNTRYDVSPGTVDIFNFIGLGPYGAIGLTQRNDTDKFSQEVRVVSDRLGAIELVAGAYYTDEDGESQDTLNDLLDPTGQPLPNILLDYLNPQTFESIAVYGNATWYISDRFDVTGGIRWTDTESTAAQVNPPMLLQVPGSGSFSESVSTYLFNARYRIENDFTAYFRFATGYRPGGPNVSLINPATGQPNFPEPFEADTLESYEIGLKTVAWDRRIQLDLSAYVIKWDEFQVSGVVNALAVNTNADNSTTSKGVELTATAYPIAGLTFSAGLAYQNATLDGDEPFLGGLEGDQMPNTPEFAGTMMADYQWSPLGNLIPSIGATLRYVSERTSTFDNNPSFAQSVLPEYTLVDLRAGIEFAGLKSKPMRLSLFAWNIFDERAQLGDQLGTWGRRVAIARPRTIGAQLSASF
jgi:iron complex outermembrane recepter protein